MLVYKLLDSAAKHCSRKTMLAYKLLDSTVKWTKRCSARDRDGWSVPVGNAGAVCWCMMGALRKCYPSPPDFLAARKKLQQVLPPSFYATDLEGTSITSANDARTTTFRQVRAWLKKAGV
jgi:hypothetical protein